MMYNNLQHILEHKKLTNRDLAEFLEVSEKTVFNKIKGDSDWTLKEVMRISKFLAPEYTIEYLFFNNDEERKDTTA